MSKALELCVWLVMVGCVATWTVPTSAQDAEVSQEVQALIKKEMAKAREQESRLAAEIEALREREAAIQAERDAAVSRREVDRRVAEAELLAAKVWKHARVSAGNVPALLNRLESEHFSMELEKIGLDARVHAIVEAIEEARNGDHSVAALAKVELKMQEKQLRAMHERYEAMKRRFDRADEEGVGRAEAVQRDVNRLEDELRAGKFRLEATASRAKVAMANPPQVKELEGELRRANIELRVVNAKLEFINAKLDRLRHATAMADQYERVRNELSRIEHARQEATEMERNMAAKIRYERLSLETEQQRVKKLREAMHAKKIGLEARQAQIEELREPAAREETQEDE